VRRALALVWVCGCYAGLDASDETSFSGDALPPTREPTSIADESSSGADIELAADDYDCIGTPILHRPGEVLVVAEDSSALELELLPAGAGFTCMRVELALDPSIVAAPAGTCPIYVALASLRGTAPGGEDLAAAFVHAFDGDATSCTRGPDRLAIGNFRELTDDVPAPTLDQPFTLRMLVQPYASRLELWRDGIRIAHASADLFPATVDDTRDPVLRLGLARAAGDTIVPWYGARYSNLRVFADVVLPHDAP
jgi:hypothetical protein